MSCSARVVRPFCTLTLLLFCMVEAFAQIPEGIDYQGYLSSATGEPLDQPVNVMFALYAVESGGVPLWAETLPLQPEQGLFSVTLGAGATPFPMGLFSTPMWLGITVGTDSEMTPRRALATTAFARRAMDSDTVGGLPASTLDQRDDVGQLQVDLSATNSDLALVDSAASQNSIAIAGQQGSIDTNTSDIGQLEVDLATTDGDVAELQSTIPTLQTRVSDSCAAGYSIRAISESGNVTCEFDDGGIWSTFGTTAYYDTGNVGIGTSAPSARLHIDAATGSDPLRARVASITALQVHDNRSVSVGSTSAGAADGLFVAGDVKLGAGTQQGRLTVTDPLWQATLANSNTGGDDWFLGSSAATWAIGAGKFVISPNDSSNNSALVIDSNKDVGIGVTDPLTRLHLGGGTDVTPSGGGYLTLGNASGSNIAIDSNEIMGRNNGNVASLSLNAQGGEVRINADGLTTADALEVTGVTRFNPSTDGDAIIVGPRSDGINSVAVIRPSLAERGWVGEASRAFRYIHSVDFRAKTLAGYGTYSDQRIKRDVRPIDNALDTIERINGVQYELMTDKLGPTPEHETPEAAFDREHQLGFVAQELEQVLPQLVTRDESSGLDVVGYMGLIPVLVEAIKEQQQRIDRQQAQIDALRERLD